MRVAREREIVEHTDGTHSAPAQTFAGRIMPDIHLAAAGWLAWQPAAKGRQIELLEDYRKSIVSGFGDVEQALIAIADGAERERLQRVVVETSRRAFDIGETRLREGTVDLVTVLITQQALFQAQDTLAVARLARLQAVLSLFQALGGAWFPPAVKGTAIKLQ